MVRFGATSAITGTGLHRTVTHAIVNQDDDVGDMASSPTRLMPVPRMTLLEVDFERESQEAAAAEAADEDPKSLNFRNRDILKAQPAFSAAELAEIGEKGRRHATRTSQRKSSAKLRKLERMRMERSIVCASRSW